MATRLLRLFLVAAILCAPGTQAQPLLPEPAALLGDAVVGFQALGEDASEALASMFDRAPVVAPLNDPYLKDRFCRYKDLRMRVLC